MSEGGDKPGGAGTQSTEGPRWAADEPTAMWDEQAIRDQGFAEAAQAPAAASGPATAPQVGGDDRSKVQTTASSAPSSSAASASAPAAPAPSSGGLSWPMTVAIACVVAVVVYFAVRVLLS